MEETANHRKTFGLIGRNISYSFSKGYFTEKFKNIGLEGHTYENFDLERIEEFENVLNQNAINGLNVTIPYKEQIIHYLHELDDVAKTIGAVNTIKFDNDRLIGYNTDAHGFEKSLTPLIKERHKKALVLGTGGASKAVIYVLDRLGIGHRYVSRNPKVGQLSYGELNQENFQEHLLIINCSPVGTHPNIDKKPDIPYSFIGRDHIVFDLIYNPMQTAFLRAGKKRGATIQNGLQMLELQAEKAWEIWNS